jgi:futalosine hydrolase
MPPDRVLLCVAAPAEVRAVLARLPADASPGAAEWAMLPIFPPSAGRAGLDLVITGVGKSNAAGATARVLDPGRHRAVVNLGICGALPGARTPNAAPAPLHTVIVATASVFADEGVVTDDGFSDMADLGFPPAPGLGPALASDPALLAALRPLADAAAPIATVSTCSGTDASASAVAARTGALAEAMEGAAVALAAHRLGVAFAEVRVVSNTTGSRTSQRWDLAGALARLSDLARVLPDALAVRPATTGEG